MGQQTGLPILIGQDHRRLVSHAYREHLSDVVAGLRQREVSWAKIAEPLGVSRQSAWDRFS